MLLQALAMATTAVVALILALGVFFLPREAKRLWGGAHVSIVDAQLLAGRPEAIMLYRTMPRDGYDGHSVRLALHDVVAGELVLRHSWPFPEALCVAGSADGRNVFVGMQDGTIAAIDPRRPHAPPRPIGKQTDGGVGTLQATRDGRLVVSRGPDAVYAWSLETLSLEWRRDDLKATNIRVCPDSKHAWCRLLGGDLVELDLADGTSRLRIASGEALREISISPDGRWLAGAADETIVWNLETLEEAYRLPGAALHSAFVAFAPSGNTLVVADPALQSLTAWQLDTGTRQQFGGHALPVVSACFLSEFRLASWDTSGKALTWQLNPSWPLQSVAQMEPDRTRAAEPWQ